MNKADNAETKQNSLILFNVVFYLFNVAYCISFYLTLYFFVYKAVFYTIYDGILFYFT
jgi:hypothetical protein